MSHVTRIDLGDAAAGWLQVAGTLAADLAAHEVGPGDIDVLVRSRASRR